MMPSQSLSMPSHEVSGMMFPLMSTETWPLGYTHFQPCAPMHIGKEPAQAPTVLQSPAGGVRPSSTAPLQSSSRPLQTSVPVEKHGPNSQPSAVMLLLL